jgi:hypothetical protein
MQKTEAHNKEHLFLLSLSHSAAIKWFLELKLWQQVLLCGAVTWFASQS